MVEESIDVTTIGDKAIYSEESLAFKVILDIYVEAMVYEEYPVKV